MVRTTPGGKTSLYTFVSPFFGNDNNGPTSKKTKIVPGNEQKLRNLIASHVSRDSNQERGARRMTVQRPSLIDVSKPRTGNTRICNVRKSTDDTIPEVKCEVAQCQIDNVSQDVLHVQKQPKVYDIKTKTKLEAKRKDKSYERRKIQLQVLGTIFKMKNELRIIQERRHKLQESLHRKRHRQTQEE